MSEKTTAATAPAGALTRARRHLCVALLAGLWLVGSAMPLGLVIVLLVGLSMYCVSVPCISMFMRTAASATPRPSPSGLPVARASAGRRVAALGRGDGFGVPSICGVWGQILPW